MLLEDVNDGLADDITLSQDGSTDNQDGHQIVGPGKRNQGSRIRGTFTDDCLAAKADDFDPYKRGSGGTLVDTTWSDVSVAPATAGGKGSLIRTIANGGRAVDGVYATNLALDGESNTSLCNIGFHSGTNDRSEHKNIYVDGLNGDSSHSFVRVLSPVDDVTVENVSGTVVNDDPEQFVFAEASVGRIRVVNPNVTLATPFFRGGQNTVSELEIEGGDVEFSTDSKAIEVRNLRRMDKLRIAGTRFAVDEDVASTSRAFHLRSSNTITNLTIEAFLSNFATGITVESGISLAHGRVDLETDSVATPYDVNEAGVTAGGVGTESADAETPTAAAWQVGDVVAFTDTGDGSGDGVYRLLPDGSWVQVGTT
jgi:hypothetical protein